MPSETKFPHRTIATRPAFLFDRENCRGSPYSDANFININIGKEMV